jgi:peptidoglycan/LPS O-acetylase OafA/YrhL
VLQTDIRKYDFIDALRGIAILGVILVHSTQLVKPTDSTLEWLASEGARGVQLFFIASALTLCMSWSARKTHEFSPVRNFYIRRFFRIAPMFYSAILGYIFLNGFSPSYWAPNGIEWWFIPITAAFLNGFHPETITSVVPGGWSIAVEMTFYLILPFLFSYIKSVKSWAFFFIFSIVSSGLNTLIAPHIFSYPESQQYLLKSFSFLNFFGQLPIFIIGILSYLILREKYPRKLVTVVCGPFFVIFLLAFLYPAFKFSNSIAADMLFNKLHHIIAGCLFCAFALLLANWPSKLLVNKITVSLGKLSFSMYLTHFAVLIFFTRFEFIEIFPKSNLASFLHFLCVALVAFLVSLFFYKYVEKPGIALGALLIENLERNVALTTLTIKVDTAL